MHSLADRIAHGESADVLDEDFPHLYSESSCRSSSRRINSFAFARAFVRRCACVFEGSDDGGLDLLRES